MLAISDGSAKRPRGIEARRAAFLSAMASESQSSRPILVSVTPGATAFARIPDGPARKARESETSARAVYIWRGVVVQARGWNGSRRTLPGCGRLTELDSHDARGLVERSLGGAVRNLILEPEECLH